MRYEHVRADMTAQDDALRQQFLGDTHRSRSSRLVAMLLSMFFILCLGFSAVDSRHLISWASTRPHQLDEVDVVAALHMQEKSIIVNGALLSYAERTAGDKNADVPLIMLHGYLDSWKSWTNVLPYIPSGRRVISLTHRGWGDSAKIGNYSIDAYVDDVAAFLAKLEINSCVLVGHSMGTLISTAVAARHPNMVVGLILCSAAATMRPEHKVSGSTTLKSIGDQINDIFSNDDHIDADGVAFLRSFQLDDLKPFIENGVVKHSFAKQVMTETRKATPRSYRDAWHNMLVENHTRELSSIQLPVLIIWGTADSLFVEKDQEMLRRALSRASISRRNVESAPHGVIWTSGPICAKHMLHWLGAVSL